MSTARQVFASWRMFCLTVETAPSSMRRECMAGRSARLQNALAQDCFTWALVREPFKRKGQHRAHPIRTRRLHSRICAVCVSLANVSVSLYYRTPSPLFVRCCFDLNFRVSRCTPDNDGRLNRRRRHQPCSPPGTTSSICRLGLSAPSQCGCTARRHRSG